jgi:hypothetical protein
MGRWWNGTDRGTPKYSDERVCLSFTPFPKNPIQIHLGLYPRIRREWTANNLSCGVEWGKGRVTGNNILEYDSLNYDLSSRELIPSRLEEQITTKSYVSIAFLRHCT